MTTAKVWYAKHEFKGEPTLDDFVMKEESLPSLRDGEILTETLYVSLDPYVRLFHTNDVLPGEQIARIVESKAPGFPKGALVSVHAGWRSKSVVDVNKVVQPGIKAELIEEVPGIPPSAWLGPLGISGLTAYLSFNERCDPKKGEVIVVSVAAGAVGSIVGQLAKMQGLKVIGLAGSKDKCEYIEKLGFDHAINYKQEDIASVLDKVAPDGIDIFYDGVGGEVSDIIYARLRNRGRVLIVGQISTYNKEKAKVTNWNMDILLKELQILGFMIFSENNVKAYARVRKILLPLIKEGKIVAKEHITEGFEKMPQAFLELFTGTNFGKVISKV